MLPISPKDGMVTIAEAGKTAESARSEEGG